MSGFETFKRELPSNEVSYSLLTDKKLVAKSINMLIRSGTSFK